MPRAADAKNYRPSAADQPAGVPAGVKTQAAILISAARSDTAIIPSRGRISARQPLRRAL